MEEELALLGRVSKLLAEHPYVAPPSEKDVVDALLRLRAELPSAKEEDKASLMEQYNQHIALLDQLREARERPVVDPACPYFAHLRLREGHVSRDLCIGKATRIQEGVRIIDWRNAPISRVFYRYSQGEEFEEEIGDRVLEGVVEARRTVSIRKGELERVVSPEGAFALTADGWRQQSHEEPRLAGGEGAAIRAHAAGSGTNRRLGTDLDGGRRRADKHLPDIAGLIDAEQFDLITRPTSGFVIIRGTAGSGKTTVALHRIAYLAYEDPRFDAPTTMFLVFSKALRDYVGHVLPALGVKRVAVDTFEGWAAQQRRRHFQRLPRKVRDDTPAAVIRLKLHPAMEVALQQQQLNVKGPPTWEQALDDWTSVLTHPELIESALAEVEPGAFSTDEIRKMTTWSRDRVDELNARLDGDRDVHPELDVEDDALLLRAWQLRVGPLRGKGRSQLRYRHIAIDEVQDFTPLEVRVLLGCLDQRQCITLAGDTQQHISKDGGFSSWAEFFRHVGVEGTEASTLRISYRCSTQIASFAQAVLGDGREDDVPPLTMRSGPEVELFRFTDHGACVAFLAEALRELVREEPLASVAVLTPTRSLSRAYHQGLSHGEVPRLRLVDQQNFTFAPGVEVTEVDQVKGLEFDYVILVEAAAAHYADTPSARRMLHVGATRAVHQLWLTTVGSLSPIVREALPHA